MKIFINGDPISITEQSLPSMKPNSIPSVADALTIYINEKQKNTTYAVALNSTFVSKQTYDDTPLKENDALDVLFPIVGG